LSVARERRDPGSRSRRGDAPPKSAPPDELVGDDAAATQRVDGPVERRRASRSLWSACEALLAAPEPRALNRALDQLREAFDCDGVALYGLGASGELEPWNARGAWRTVPGDLRDCMSVPLFRNTERVGTLDLQARAGQRWRPGQLALIRTAAGALGAALGARLELERLRRQPGRDSVTGLPDAAAFHARLGEELARARRHGLPLAVVLLDLDHFGALNARYGRGVGDDTLAETALMLKLQLRDTDLVARLGADTFGVLLPETGAGPAARCASRVRRALEEHAFARVGHLSASAGVAAGPRDGVEAVALLDEADRSLAVAKKSGRRRTVVAAPTHVH
jgi:diguanylate cyclase (GGDEF)-like protein